MDTAILAQIFAWYLVFVFSTVLHEASHALAALKLGDRTAFEGGQVTLDPTPHVRREPFGMVLVPLLSCFLYQGNFMIGWASAPYDPQWERQFPRRSALMALAGPLSNLLLVVISGILIRVGMSLDWFEPSRSLTGIPSLIVGAEGTFYAGLATILSIFFGLNLLLFFFNLIPVPPLDGSSVVMLAMSPRQARKYLDFIHDSLFSRFGILVAWLLIFKFYGLVFVPCINLLMMGTGIRYGS